MDEFFEIITLIQTKKISSQIKVVLIGKEFWKPLCKYLEEVVFEREHDVDPNDLRIYHMTDSVDDAYRVILQSKMREITI